MLLRTWYRRPRYINTDKIAWYGTCMESKSNYCIYCLAPGVLDGGMNLYGGGDGGNGALTNSRADIFSFDSHDDAEDVLEEIINHITLGTKKLEIYLSEEGDCYEIYADGSLCKKIEKTTANDDDAQQEA